MQRKLLETSAVLRQTKPHVGVLTASHRRFGSWTIVKAIFGCSFGITPAPANHLQEIEDKTLVGTSNRRYCDMGQRASLSE